MRLVITCEHAGNDVPPEYAHLFAGRQHLLNSHRGYDPGALALAEIFASHFQAPLIAHRQTRLLVEPNRSLDNHELFSALTARLDGQERERILDCYYHPFRKTVAEELRRLAAAGEQILHVSVHSFTPVLRGRRRPVTVGLLFDPARRREKQLASTWRATLQQRRPRLAVALNQPYLGTDDGHVTHLRTLFPDQVYAGLEIELSQAVVRRPSWFEGLSRDLVASLGDTQLALLDAEELPSQFAKSQLNEE